MAACKDQILFQKGESDRPPECPQGPVIYRIDEKLDKLDAAISIIASQNVRLDGLDLHNKEQDQSISILYERVREIDMVLGVKGEAIALKTLKELEPWTGVIDRLERLIIIITSKPVLTAIFVLGAMVLVGAICDFIYHPDVIAVVRKVTGK